LARFTVIGAALSVLAGLGANLFAAGLAVLDDLFFSSHHFGC
jgi:hypothetical protein